MHGKTVVITGATSGIGEVAAVDLAKSGARIVLIARDQKRANATLAKLKMANPAAEHALHLANLAEVDEMKRVALSIAQAEPRIDVLINNAGALFSERRVTKDGLEMTFAVNHMAYFVVTNLLLERLRATPSARIVSTASAAHYGARLDFADLQALKGYNSYAAYGRSKLCNILFTRALAKRLQASGVTANCLHPGFVATRFGDNTNAVSSSAIRLAKLGAISPARGAETIIYLASSPDAANYSGRYFNRCKPTTPSVEAQSDDDAEFLWGVSQQIMDAAAA